jgi:tetratricopeptide (TPR) repeat protein
MSKEAGDLPIKTATMAKIFAQQGHFDEAIEIYRYLLSKDPEQKDLADALARTAEKRDKELAAGPRDIVSTLSNYIGLLLNFRQLFDLQDLQRQIVSKKRSE